MKVYQTTFQEYIQSHPSKYGQNDIHSILEMLYHHYTEENPIDNLTIREKFRSLEPYFSHLTSKQNDLVFDLICDLCIAHEKNAFLMGFRVGFMINEELQN